MDPITIASTAFQLASLAQTIYSYIDSVNKAEKWLKPIGDHVRITSSVLENVATILANDDIRNSCTPALLQTTNAALDGCRGAFEDLDALLRTFFKPDKSGRVVLSTFAKLTLTFRQSEIGVLQAHLDRFKSSLDLVLGVLNLAITTKGKKDHDEIQNIKIEVRKLMKAEQEAKDNEKRIAERMHQGRQIEKLPQRSVPIHPLEVQLFAMQHQGHFPSSTMSKPDSSPAHSKGSKTNAAPPVPSDAPQPATGSTHMLSPSSPPNPRIAPPIILPSTPPDQTILYHHLNKCAEAATKLASTIEQVTTQWQYARQYQRNSLATAFEVTKHALESLSAYEHHLICDAKGLHSEADATKPPQPLQGRVISKVPSPKATSPNNTVRWPSWSRRKAKALPPPNEPKMQLPTPPISGVYGAARGPKPLSSNAVPSQSPGESSPYNTLSPRPFNRTGEPETIVQPSSKPPSMPRSSNNVYSEPPPPPSPRSFGAYSRGYNPDALPAHEYPDQASTMMQGGNKRLTSVAGAERSFGPAATPSASSGNRNNEASNVTIPSTRHGGGYVPYRPNVPVTEDGKTYFEAQSEEEDLEGETKSGLNVQELSSKRLRDLSTSLGAEHDIQSEALHSSATDRVQRKGGKAPLPPPAKRTQRTSSYRIINNPHDSDESSDSSFETSLYRSRMDTDDRSKANQKRAAHIAQMEWEFSRLGGVDDKSKTMNSQPLFVANPNLSDDEEFTIHPQARNSNKDRANFSAPDKPPHAPTLPDTPTLTSATGYLPPSIGSPIRTAPGTSAHLAATQGYAYPNAIIEDEPSRLEFDDPIQDVDDENYSSDEGVTASLSVFGGPLGTMMGGDTIEHEIGGPDVSDVDELLKQWTGIEA